MGRNDEQTSLFPPLPPPSRATYGSGIKQAPKHPGRRGTPHMDAIYLDQILPWRIMTRSLFYFLAAKIAWLAFWISWSAGCQRRR